MNSERRSIFSQKVLSHYNHQSENFDKFIEETKQILESKHNIKMTLVQVRNNFFKNYYQNIKECIWNFLEISDKKELKNVNNIELDDQATIQFIEGYANKIKEYVSYVKNYKGSSSNEDCQAIYSYLAKNYGWTIDYIKEMDELELFKSIEQAIIINKRENIESINSQALAAAYAAGNKGAKSQIDGMRRKMQRETEMKKMAVDNPNFEMKNELTREQMAKILGVK